MKLKYVKTISKLAEILGISRQELQDKWINKPGWPSKTSHGWDIEACHEFWQNDKRKTVENTAGINCDVKRRKLIAEADLKEMEVKEKTGSVIGYQKYVEHMERLAEIYKSAFLEFSQWFTALHPEPENIKKLEELQNRARQRLREVINGFLES